MLKLKSQDLEYIVLQTRIYSFGFECLNLIKIGGIRDWKKLFFEFSEKSFDP